MSHGHFTAIVLPILIASSVATARANTSAQSPNPACDVVNQTYKACGAKFDYSGRDFTFNDGGVKRTVMCSDGRRLDFYDRVNSMDVASIFMFDYPKGNTPLPETRLNYDAGRLRVEELLKQIYGYNESNSHSHLVRVPFLKQTLLFNEKMGAASALRDAGVELLELAKNDRAVARFLSPWTSGQKDLRLNTFEWRVIAGTQRLSAHSFGTAIDLVTDTGPQYWLWDEKRDHPDRAKKGEEAYRNIHYIPKAAPIWNMKIVEIMEKHGFIWGAKWNHYDAMHFEYRPEFYPNLKINCAGSPLKPREFERATEAEINEIARLQTENRETERRQFGLDERDDD